MNTTWKRIGGVVAIILSIVVLLAGIGGVVGLWVLNSSAHDLTSAIFSPIQSGLDTANTGLSNVNTHVTNGRDRISNAQQFVGQLGQNTTSNGTVLGAISDTVATRLEPQLEQAQESISNTLDFVTGVNQSIVAVNRLPGVDLPTLSDARQALQPRASTLGDKVQGLRTDLQSMVQGRLQITADRVNSLLMDLDSTLQNIQTSVTTFNGKVQQVQTKVNDLESNITTWITVGWLVGTILCLWVVVSQVIMIRYGWSLIRSKSTDLSVPSAPEAGGDTPSPATS